MIREIFVPLLRTTADDAALDAALALAADRGAYLTTMIALTQPLPMVSGLGIPMVAPDQRQFEVERHAAATLADRTRARLAHETVPSEVRVTESFATWGEDAAALQALHCDLSIVGRPTGDGQAAQPFSRMFRSLLLRSGRPVLVVPQDATLLPPIRRVVLAWKPTPEASRALHEALPLLSRTAQIDVLVVDPLVTGGGYGEQPGADVARLIARHGFSARVVERPGEGESTGNCLLRHVRESGADLLVMGGYGHRHWRELVLGGATREVVGATLTPVLFSH